MVELVTTLDVPWTFTFVLVMWPRPTWRRKGAKRFCARFIQSECILRKLLILHCINSQILQRMTLMIKGHSWVLRRDTAFNRTCRPCYGRDDRDQKRSRFLFTVQMLGSCTLNNPTQSSFQQWLEDVSMNNIKMSKTNAYFMCFLSYFLQTFLRVRANRQTRLNGMYTTPFPYYLLQLCVS